MNMVIHKGGEQVVGNTDRMQIPGEMKIDIFHGNHLRIATTSSPSFHTKYRTKRGFTQTNHCVLTDSS